ncbi:MAG: zinc-binding alcohol dehydrogenase [Armatimonadetes bacterium]|nr:zinc-binding alcohol dehydrogenase [Armatimonadota bacterium]
MKPTVRVVWPEPGRVEMESFVPDPPAPDQILARARYTLISPGTERAWLLGLPNTPRHFPIYPGYSFIGVVEAVGEEVRSVQPGDLIAAPAPHAGAVLTRADEAVPLPAGIDLEAAAFFNLAAITLQGVRKARLEIGESVAVLGQGLVGQLAVRLARLGGACPVAALDLSPRRLAFSEGAADACLNPEAADFSDRLRALCTPDGPDVVIEATGRPEPVITALQMARPHGRVVLLASTRGVTDGVNFYTDVHCKGLQVIGAHTYARPARDSAPGWWTWRDDVTAFFRLVQTRRLDPRPLITDRIPAQYAPQAYHRLAQWDEKIMGVLFQWPE